MKTKRLSEQQRNAVRRGSRRRWLTCAQNGVIGTTMDALRRRGLAEVGWDGRAMKYRLTDAGEELRLAMLAKRRAEKARAGVERGRAAAALKPAGTEDGYLVEMWLRDELSEAEMELALMIRRRMHGEWWAEKWRSWSGERGHARRLVTRGLLGAR